MKESIRFDPSVKGPFHVEYLPGDAFRWRVMDRGGKRVLILCLTRFFAMRRCRKLNRLWEETKSVYGKGKP